MNINTMFILTLAIYQDTQSEIKTPLGTAVMLKVRVSLSYMCAATNKAPLLCSRQFSSLCEIHNTSGLD